jgi:hypothetical protein
MALESRWREGSGSALLRQQLDPYDEVVAAAARNPRTAVLARDLGTRRSVLAPEGLADLGRELAQRWSIAPATSVRFGEEPPFKLEVFPHKYLH